jgi:GT2 family glycosyltransferase
MTSPLVSVLIPAHNAAPWIRGTLGSVLRQTWPHTEVVVVDDGSTDDTAALVESVRSPMVRLIRQPHKGPSATQNEALRHARGEFIQRLDADDLLSPDKIALQMARLVGAPGAVAAGQWGRFHDDPSDAQFRRNAVSADLSPDEWLRRECTGGLPMLQPGLWLAPRAVVEAAGPWDERLTLNNDFDYGVRLLLASECVLFCSDARLFYRSGNATSLASVRSPAAWRSALLSLELGTDAMLQRSGTEGLRRACADLFQQLTYAAYLEAPEVAQAAEAHARRRGGSKVPMTGGLLFNLMRNATGWRQATRVKRFFYRAGYGRVARLKEATVRRSLGL